MQAPNIILTFGGLLLVAGDSLAAMKFFQRIPEGERSMEPVGVVLRRANDDSGDLFVAASQDHLSTSPWTQDKTLRFIEKDAANPDAASLGNPLHSSAKYAEVNPENLASQYYQSAQYYYNPQASAVHAQGTSSDVVGVAVDDEDKNAVMAAWANYIQQLIPQLVMMNNWIAAQTAPQVVAASAASPTDPQIALKQAAEPKLTNPDPTVPTKL